MNFGNFGMMEMIILLVVVLLLFGAKRIPEIAGSLGKGITEFKRNINDAQKQITEPARSERVPPPPASSTPDEDRPEPKRLLN